MREQAMEGVRVLDLTHLIAGPYCTKILAGFGAEVLKIEKPGRGDEARHMGPFLDDLPGAERSGLFLYLNGNKKSITLNLKSATGTIIFKELVKDADVVVENFSPGTMQRLGLDYRALKQINPGLVMASISNFGQSGPYRDYKSSHLVAWGMSGGRYTDGEPDKRPVQSGGWLTHYIAGLFAVAGTVTALYQQKESGEGRHVDVSILESIMAMTLYPATANSYRQTIYSSGGKGYLGILPCKDGHIGLNAYTELHRELVFAFLGMPELAEDPRFRDRFHLRDNLDQARSIVTKKVKEREKMELFQSGNEWRIPVGLVPTTEEILESSQHRARGFLEEVEHPVMGRVTMPGAPFKMMETPWRSRSAAPLLGEHNEEIYCGVLNYDRKDLVVMSERGVI
jgi:crotonobetainyl-CoA:carnitine CoA-transferase CaiB-like acyl-CoA transferase